MMLAQEIASDLGLTFRVDYASDPFFGRVGQMKAGNFRLLDGKQRKHRREWGMHVHNVVVAVAKHMAHIASQCPTDGDPAL